MHPPADETRDPSPPPLDDLAAHARFVAAVARRILGDEHAAEDVAQDSILSAMRRPPRHQENVKAWLATVVDRNARHYRRGRERREKREHRTPAPAAVPTPDQLVEKQAMAEGLVRAVDGLDEPYRTVVLRRFYLGEEPAQIAAVMGVSSQTVRTQLHRALCQLRVRLEASGSDHAPDRLSIGLALVAYGGSRGLVFRAPISVGQLASAARRSGSRAVRLGAAAAATVVAASWMAWVGWTDLRPSVPTTPRTPAVVAALPAVASSPRPAADTTAVASAMTLQSGQVAFAPASVPALPILRMEPWPGCDALRSLVVATPPECRATEIQIGIEPTGLGDADGAVGFVSPLAVARGDRGPSYDGSPFAGPAGWGRASIDLAPSGPDAIGNPARLLAGYARDGHVWETPITQRPIVYVGPTRLLSQSLDGNACTPAVDGTGSVLYFVRHVGEHDRTRIWVARRQPSGLFADAEPVTNVGLGDDQLRPVPTPDNRALLFTASGGPVGNNFHLYVAIGDPADPWSLRSACALENVNGGPDVADHDAIVVADPSDRSRGLLVFASDRDGANDLYLSPPVEQGFGPRSWGRPIRLRLRDRTPDARAIVEPAAALRPDGSLELIYVAATKTGLRSWVTTNPSFSTASDPSAWTAPTPLDCLESPSRTRPRGAFFDYQTGSLIFEAIVNGQRQVFELTF